MPSWLIWVIVAIVVVAVIAAVVATSNKKKQERNRTRAAELREQAVAQASGVQQREAHAKETEAKAAQARQVALAAGGMVVSENSSAVPDSTGGVDKQGSRSSLSLAVPAATLDRVLDDLGKLGTTVQRSSSARDVTSTYVDTQSRVSTMKAGVDQAASGDLSRVRALGSTGSPLSEEVQRWGTAQFQAAGSKDIWWCNISGGTDFCGAFVGGNRGARHRDAKLAGEPRNGGDLRHRDRRAFASARARVQPGEQRVGGRQRARFVDAAMLHRDAAHVRPPVATSIARSASR